MTKDFSLTDFFDTNQPYKIVRKNEQNMSLEWNIANVTRCIQRCSMIGLKETMCLVVTDRRSFPLGMYEPLLQHQFSDADCLGFCTIDGIDFKVFECPTAPEYCIGNSQMAVVQLSNGCDYKVLPSDPVEVYVAMSEKYPYGSPRYYGVVEF